MPSPEGVVTPLRWCAEENERPGAGCGVGFAKVVAAIESGGLLGTVAHPRLERLRAAARATGTKARRVNIRLSSADVRDIQALAWREGIPYQTLIASILHKYVAGRSVERG